MRPSQTHLGIFIQYLQALLSVPAKREVKTFLEFSYRDAYGVRSAAYCLNTLVGRTGFHRHMTNPPDVFGAAVGIEVMERTTATSKEELYEKKKGELHSH